jgi:hypothetical protein
MAGDFKFFNIYWVLLIETDFENEPFGDPGALLTWDPKFFSDSGLLLKFFLKDSSALD